MITHYQNLANAIILSAITDYRRALHTLSTNPKSKAELAQVKEIERFFLSEYFLVLTNLDPSVLIAQMYKEYNINREEVSE